MSGRRILFVDDEPSIRLTLPAILKMKGFEVTATATVSEALAAMQAHKFDVLIADLNIGQPGDGFTAVSAMRRTQPQAVTIILTGFPAFETALEAIRRQVDDYLVKPADVDHLVQMIERKMQDHTPASHIDPKRLSDIVRDNESAIRERWLKEVKADPALGSLKLTDEERVDHLPDLLHELESMLDEHSAIERRTSIQIAVQYGNTRRRQGMPLPLLMAEMRALRQVLYRLIQENLLAVNVSFVITDMIVISDNLDQQVQTAIEAYLSGQGETQLAS